MMAVLHDDCLPERLSYIMTGGWQGNDGGGGHRKGAPEYAPAFVRATPHA